MNFREQLLTELSRKNVDYIIHSMGDNEDYFAEIIRLILTDTDPIPQRASWVADGVCLKYPALIEKHLPALIEALPSFTHSGTRRNILKIISRTNIPEDYQGVLIDMCFNLLADTDEPVAVRVHAMQIIANHLPEYPELANELREVIEDQADKSSPGLRARGRKILGKRGGL